MKSPGCGLILGIITVVIVIAIVYGGGLLFESILVDFHQQKQMEKEEKMKQFFAGCPDGGCYSNACVATAEGIRCFHVE